MARRKRRLGGLPSEHAEIANHILDRVGSVIERANRAVRRGECRNAIKDLANAHEHFGRGKSNFDHADGQASGAKLRSTQNELQIATDYVIGACARGR